MEMGEKEERSWKEVERRVKKEEGMWVIVNRDENENEWRVRAIC
jgi:hypothetical protein